VDDSSTLVTDVPIPVSESVLVTCRDPDDDEEVQIDDEIVVVVEKKSIDEKTGLEIRQRTKSIEIHGVQEGPIAEWNRAHPVRAVKRGDVLVAVNGVRGPTSVELVDAFKSGLTLQLTFIRKS